tara:strand:+ start:109 stop:450 length:342 start_codon:yes stop_codon:yes gene_type:complete
MLLIPSGVNLFRVKEIEKILNNIILVFLVLIFLLSFYHSGIEIGFFSNVISCTQNSYEANTIEELDIMLRNLKNNDCAYPKFHIFNLSLSNLSLLLSIVLFFLCLKFLKRNIF